MRLSSVFAVAAVALLATTASASEPTDTKRDILAADVSPNAGKLRHLRTRNTAANKDDEERATMVLEGVLLDKAATNTQLSKWLSEGKTPEAVAAKLEMLDAPLDTSKLKPNWAALVKYWKMHFAQTHGVTLPYAKFGVGYQTEEKTKEHLAKWVMRGYSTENVAKRLDIDPKLPMSELVVHQNYKAYKKFVKWKEQWEKLRGNGFTSME